MVIGTTMDEVIRCNKIHGSGITAAYYYQIFYQGGNSGHTCFGGKDVRVRERNN